MVLMGEEKAIQAQEKLMGELNLGREFAQQLLNLFPYLQGNEGIKPQRVLAEAVVQSFDDAIAILGPKDSGWKTAGGQIGIDSSAGCRTSQSTGTRGREGSKKRKVAQIPATTATVMAINADDGYAWRKYGQKDILGSKYPRDYFRCTHKSDQGCQAKKHVQKLDRDSSLLRVTYFGTHTCNPTCTIPELEEAASSCQRREFFLNFDTCNSVPSGFSISSFSRIKGQNQNEVPAPMNHQASNSFPTSSLGSDIAETPCLLNQHGPMGSDNSDAASGQCSFPGLDMGFATFVEFDDLDHCHFFSA